MTSDVKPSDNRWADMWESAFAESERRARAIITETLTDPDVLDTLAAAVMVRLREQIKAAIAGGAEPPQIVSGKVFQSTPGQE